ncbi:ATP-dependent DNA helicase RecQ [Rubrivirga sp. S365]|uniref:ATP-dependent DNA helicase RecQ n=1 Tax=Rubrivirga sp. S365 TaxID=3076080 RepID=UPI0028D67E7F|nr:ATP-dependent DNA helicase RecQ [Rubrivirga sp. S365]
MPAAPTAAPPVAPGYQPEAVRRALREHFGFDDLRPGQADALRPVLDGQDTLVVMPTGAGKSLVYQLGALLKPDGVTVVVSPLIALMKDQVDALTRRGVAAAYVNSSQTADEQRDVLARLRRGELAMIYAAPERLRVPSFQRSLREAHVALLAVDEAHCVSQWGHDFRPDYLNIAAAREAMGSPPCVALTATATSRVQDDIAAQLQLRHPAHLVTGFNRPNLRFEVKQTATKKQKRRVLKQFLDEHQGEAGLIYVGTRKDCEAVAQFVRDETGRPCEAYHAGLPDAERSHVQEQFIAGRLDTVVATNAFGMGVDRGDVRFVAHWSIPSNLEAYYQEAGRAGRDGRPATALLLYAPQDRQLKEWFIEQGAPTVDDLRRVWGYVKRAAKNAAPPEDGERAETDGDFLLRMSDALGIHGAKLPNVLSRLRRAGALAEREDRMGAGRWVPQAWDATAVSQALKSIEKHSGDQSASLLGIVRYAQSSDCRRRTILDHFGDDAATDVDPAECCDACRTNARLKGDAPDELPDWDALPMNSRVALGLLDAVRRLRWPVGRVTLAKILAGSKAKGMDKYERHPYYGRLQTIGQGAADGIYKDLLLKGYLRIGGDEYPVIELTPLGDQALDHREAIDVEVPAFGSGRRSGGAARSSGGVEADDLSAEDEALFETLRAWRTEQATEKAVPPYVVFNDKTLRALAAHRPTTDAEMLAVKGVGPAKWDAYGADVLRIVAEAA